MNDEQDPVLTLHNSGEVTISHFPQTLLIARELLRLPDTLLSRSGRTLHIDVANGRARYRLQRQHENGRAIVAQLVWKDGPR